MEEQITKTPNKEKSMYLGIILILCLILFVSIFLYLRNKQNCTEDLSNQTTITKENNFTKDVLNPNNEDNEIFTVNSHNLNIYKVNDNSSLYLTFQVDYPSKYSVFSDDMLDSYITQGGSAKPALTFSQIRNPLDERMIENAIFIRVSRHIKDIDDWRFAGEDENYTVIEEDEVKKENFKIQKRTLSYESKDSPVYEAYIFLPENNSYFFETNGNIPKEDFDLIVDSIRIRRFDLEELNN